MESRLNPNSTRKIVQQFNNWLQELESFSIIDIPAKSFTQSERSTQTGTKFIFIQKKNFSHFSFSTILKYIPEALR